MRRLVLEEHAKQPGGGDALRMFDVGCNKGYDTALFFEVFAPGIGLNRIRLRPFYESELYKACGANACD